MTSLNSRIMKVLPPAQRALFHLLKVRKDVPIARLYRMNHIDRPEPRKQQQIIGSTISKLNKKLREHRLVIKPGEKRGTYRLRSL